MSRSLTARNHLGAVRRHHPDDEAAVLAARRDLAEAKIADHIQRTVDAAPPLTQEQRSRLALLLSGGDAA